MTFDEIREIENFVISKRLSEVNDADNLQFLAKLIDSHDFLRSKLMSEPDKRLRGAKLEAMRPYLPFKALSLDKYELAEKALRCGVQPIYEEQEQLERSRIWMPSSVPFMVRG